VGGVLEDTLPRLQPTPGSSGGMEADGGDTARAVQPGFTASVAAFVQRACQHLVLPAASYLPVPYVGV
jgi:hypothetical protein